MMTGLVMYGGITIIVGVIAILDWLARRKERQSHDRVA
jgi:hypothetical protein